MRRYIFILLAACSLCSCAKKDWWVGTWQLDRKYTEAENPTNNMTPLNRAGLSLGCSLLAGANYVISKDEIGVYYQNGTGGGAPYSVITNLSDTSVRFVCQDITNTFSLKNGMLVLTRKGDKGMDVRYYFKPQ